MLAIPNSLRLPVDEADHGVFPVSNVVVYGLFKDRWPVVVRIKIHIERVNDPGAMVVNDDTAGSPSQSALLQRFRERNGVRIPNV